ncbi:MAG: DUF4328 domain-containing protein [Henriciella sp.]|jgi:hypothetical protein
MTEYHSKNTAVNSANNEYTDQTNINNSKHAYIDGPKSTEGLMKWVKYSIYGYIVFEILLLIASATFTYIPETWDSNSSDPNDVYALVGLGLSVSALAYIVAFAISAFLVARFSYRAMRNLHTINSTKAEMSPALTVGWYFIPFANLWKPANGMSQIYHGSHAALGEKSESTSPIPLWWISWLLTTTTGNISSRIPDYNMLTLTLDSMSCIAGVVSALTLLKICTRI